MTLCFLSEKYRRIAFAAAACLVLSVFLISAFAVSRACRYAEDHGMTYSLNARDSSEQRDFARQFGLTVSEYPVMIQKVTIPEEFDEFYSGYNELQKTVGLDLYPYRGKKCTLYTYCIENNINDCPSSVNLLVFRGRVVGGDVTENKYKGIIRSFSGKIYNTKA